MEGRGVFKIMLARSLNRVGQGVVGRGMARRGHRVWKTTSAAVTKAEEADSIHFSFI